MKKIKQYKGYIIAICRKQEYHIFTKEEWAYGSGYRYEEFYCDNLQECFDWIDSEVVAV